MKLKLAAEVYNATHTEIYVIDALSEKKYAPPSAHVYDPSCAENVRGRQGTLHILHDVADADPPELCIHTRKNMLMYPCIGTYVCVGMNEKLFSCIKKFKGNQKVHNMNVPDC